MLRFMTSLLLLLSTLLSWSTLSIAVDSELASLAEDCGDLIALQIDFVKLNLRQVGSKSFDHSMEVLQFSLKHNDSSGSESTLFERQTVEDPSGRLVLCLRSNKIFRLSVHSYVPSSIFDQTRQLNSGASVSGAVICEMYHISLDEMFEVTPLILSHCIAHPVTEQKIQLRSKTVLTSTRSFITKSTQSEPVLFAVDPTVTPSWSPSYTPTSIHPTVTSTLIPTITPTTSPTTPTITPTQTPTRKPTKQKPTADPTPLPTSIPTSIPTSYPSSYPTPTPTSIPTSIPTSYPSPEPTSLPTSMPTQGCNPSIQPIGQPTSQPSSSPSSPSLQPTSQPSRPTALPTPLPTTPTVVPTLQPTTLPSTSLPTLLSTIQPSTQSTSTPSVAPSVLPTAPSAQPTETPTTPTTIPTTIPIVMPTSAVPTVTSSVSAIPTIESTLQPSTVVTTPTPTYKPTIVTTVFTTRHEPPGSTPQEASGSRQAFVETNTGIGTIAAAGVVGVTIIILGVYYIVRVSQNLVKVPQAPANLAMQI